MRQMGGVLLLLAGFVLNVPVMADGDGGDAFRQTAREYDEKARYYQQKQQADKVRVYQRMAEIKRNAARLADEGRWEEIDWSEYHQLEKQLYH